MVSGHPGQPLTWVLLVAGDSCPQWQQSWEQSSCLHPGGRRRSLAPVQGAKDACAGEGQAGMQEDLRVL